MFRGFQIDAQVGINTTTPSPASILEISSTQDNINFGGLMPPRVSTIANRNSINPDTSDIGLLVFVEEVLCYQIWNGTSWEDIHCLNTVSLLGIFQNFDTIPAGAIEVMYLSLIMEMMVSSELQIACLLYTSPSPRDV